MSEQIIMGFRRPKCSAKGQRPHQMIGTKKALTAVQHINARGYRPRQSPQAVDEKHSVPLEISGTVER